MITLIICDDSRVARHLYSLLDGGSRPPPENAFFFRARNRKGEHLILSTNGHLQLFQNSSIYKWSGVDPQRIIEDPNSVIPVLNVFSKNNFHSLHKILASERIGTCVIAIPPDISSLTIGLKEVGNVFQTNGFVKVPRKLLLVSLDPSGKLPDFNTLGTFTFDDRKAAEIEYTRMYLDAIISFSITQEITYTIKRVMDMDAPEFKELKQMLAGDVKEGKNFLVPMSRAQAMVLTWVHQNNKTVVSGDSAGVESEYRVLLRVASTDGTFPVVPLNLTFQDEASAQALATVIKQQGTVRIEKVSDSDQVMNPPGLFDITDLVTHVSERYGFPTTYTYKILLDLYYARYITYPNPERVAVGDQAFNHEAILQGMLAIDALEDIATTALAIAGEASMARFKATLARSPDAILPVQAGTPSAPFFQARPNHWKVHAIILKRYAKQFLEPSRVARHDLLLALPGGRSETASSYTILEGGFLAFHERDTGEAFPAIKYNVLASLGIEDATVERREKRGAYFTDASLLKEIKDKNLGDTVSYLLMIEKLIGNNYLHVINKNLKLTKRGDMIARFLGNTFDFLGGLEFTVFYTDKLLGLQSATSDEQLHAMIAGAKREILAGFLERFKAARQKTAEYLLRLGIDIEKPSGLRFEMERHKRFPAMPDARVFCECGSPMKLIEAKTGARFLACENRLECGKTAPLPREGTITIVQKTCMACSNVVVRVQPGDRAPFHFCPTCMAAVLGGQEPRSVGHCPACEMRDACWDEGAPPGEKTLHDAAVLIHAGAFEICPKCTKSSMVPVKDASGSMSLACENPLCNHAIPVHPVIAASMEPTTHKCLICPMNAVTFRKGDQGPAYHACINCLDKHARNKSLQAGFCIGCIHHDACFDPGKAGQAVSVQSMQAAVAARVGTPQPARKRNA